MDYIHVLHENSAWTAPLLAELDQRRLPYQDWHLAAGQFDLSAPPPQGVFYSRMSASAHTRDHRFAPEYADAVIQWLEGHGRRVINGSRAIRLELSKVAQYAALQAAGIATPRTHAALGREAGHALTYDINTNTNYNPEAEARLAATGHSGMGGEGGMASVAAYLGRELAAGRYNDDLVNVA